MPNADEWNLYSLSFDDFSLDENEMLLAAVTMFTELGLVSKFNIDKKVKTQIYFPSQRGDPEPHLGTKVPKVTFIRSRIFHQNFPKIFNQNFLGKLTKIFPKFLWNFLNNY